MSTSNLCLQNAIQQQPPKLHPLERWRLDCLCWKQVQFVFQYFDAIIFFPYPTGSELACLQEWKDFADQHKPKFDPNAIYHRRCPRTTVPYVFWLNYVIVWVRIRVVIWFLWWMLLCSKASRQVPGNDQGSVYIGSGDPTTYGYANPQAQPHDLQRICSLPKLGNCMLYWITFIWFVLSR